MGAFFFFFFFVFVNAAPHPGALYRPVWERQLTPPLTPSPQPAYEQWAAQLTSSDLSSQYGLVERAWVASTGVGVPDLRKPSHLVGAQASAPKARLTKIPPPPFRKLLLFLMHKRDMVSTVYSL